MESLSGAGELSTTTPSFPLPDALRAAARAVLVDLRSSRAGAGPPPPGPPPTSGSARPPPTRSSDDPPGRTRLRNLILRAFTARRGEDRLWARV